MEWELWGFFGAQGLDTRICWENLRKIVSEGRSVLTLRNPTSQNRDVGVPAPVFVTYFRPGRPAKRKH
jgi:hypothetical protein